LYLTTIIDLYDRKIIGWSLNDKMSTENNILFDRRMATRNRNVEKGLIFQSDRGVQYANNKFANILNSINKINQSMSRKDNCWDNEVAESFFKSLKTELIYGNKLISKEQMKLEIFEYIEIWYNKKRRHSALNYATIDEFIINLITKMSLNLISNFYYYIQNQFLTKEKKLFYKIIV
jgi:transposase InsO family protein